jgi:two-component system CheB/CheR fusion protein
LPVDIVKIDKGFVAELGDPTTSAIVSTVVGLAHILGMTVVAEGVETAAQYDEVAAFGCEESQGYFFARPMSSDSLSALMLGEPGDGTLQLPVPVVV